MDKSTADTVERLEERILCLSKEKAALAKDLKRVRMKNGLFRAVVEEMQGLITPFESLPKASPKHYKQSDKLIDETLVIHWSDWHADEVVESHKVGGLEEFNFNVAMCRAEILVDSIINWTQATLANHRFKKCVILMYGDMTSGQIHEGEGRSHYRNMMRNSLAIGQLISLCVRDLAPFFDRIEVVCLSGNHGRRSVKKDYDGAWSNWDYLISEIAAMQSARLTNVKFHIPDNWSLTLDIEGHGFCIAHGDDIKAWNGIPFYGIERKTRRLTALHNSVGKQVKYFVFGHFHALTQSAELKGETIINGAFPATSPYSYESFAGYREPMQLIHGVSPRYGMTWRLPVKVKDSDYETKGPRRYKVILAQPGFEGLAD